MDISEILKLVGGSLTIAGVIVGITRYVTQLQLQGKQDRLEAENERLKAEKGSYDARFANLEAKYKEIADEMIISKRIGKEALILKKEIDDDLVQIMNYLQAQGGSVFIPLNASNGMEAQGLIFLSIQPFGKEASLLKRKIIPIKSLAGRCFISGEPFVRPSSKKDPDHFKQADQVSGYHTEDVLNIPLVHLKKVVGVLQLLNKSGPNRFENSDLANAEPFATALAPKVVEFMSNPERIEILGITAEKDSEYATVMFCDITNSRLLFKEMNPAMAIQHLNEYLEKICTIAFSYGATIDKYMGDGVLLRFNVPRPVDNHPLNAVKAALQIKEEFERLKKEWITLGDLVSDLYIRIGIGYGQVNQAIIGHPQYQYLSIFGSSVNVAVNICEEADRTKSIIVIDDNIYKKLQNKLIVEKVPNEKLGKAISFIAAGYNLNGIMA